MLFSLLGLLGCEPRTQNPEQAGVSQPLAYPVLLIGQASLDVRDDEQSLISIPGASSLNLVERVVLDSRGDLFHVTRATPVAGQPSPLWSMGTQARNYTVILARQTRPSWAQVQRLVLDQLSAPNSIWVGSTQAAARVKALSGVTELIAASRQSWNWSTPGHQSEPANTEPPR